MMHPDELKRAIEQRHQGLLAEAEQWRLCKAQGKNRQHMPMQVVYRVLLQLGGRCVHWAMHWNPRTPIGQH